MDYVLPMRTGIRSAYYHLTWLVEICEADPRVLKIELLRLLVTRVGTYVQRGSKFCFVVLVVGVTDIAQNTALLSNFKKDTVCPF
jgi:hypothetical protein